MIAVMRSVVMMIVGGVVVESAGMGVVVGAVVVGDVIVGDVVVGGVVVGGVVVGGVV